MAKTLSLLAAFDDLMRCTSVLAESSIEQEFIRFVRNQEECRKKWLQAIEDCQRLQSEHEKDQKKISELEGKLFHARRILDKEKKRRVDGENYIAALERKLSLVRELVFVDGGAMINDETREKLGFLNTTSTSIGVHDEPMGRPSRLNTISEAMDSTGSLLSDLSYSRSEDDLDITELRSGKVWRKHRPSLPAQDEASSAKRRRSDVREKSVELNRSGTGDRVIATATVTVSKGCQSKATARVETIPASNPITRHETPYRLPKPTAPPPGTDSESDDSSWGTGKVNVNTPQTTPRGIASLEMSPSIGGVYPFRMNNNVHNRVHHFCNKTVIYPENCGPCGKRIKFGKVALKCRDCRAACHPECREQVPLPCVPVSNTPTRKGGNGNTIADYAPPTAPMVPALVVHCLKEIEARGLMEVGLYRVPGSERDVKSLKEKFMRGKGVPNLSKVDVHVICGTVKDFLRSLSQPLVLQSQWQAFTQAADDSDTEVGRALMIQAIAELPQPNRDTLAYLIMHLQRVAECPECKMPASNLAKVFGPTIVGYSSLNPEPATMLSETQKQVAVVEHLMSIPSDYWAHFAQADGVISNTPSEVYLTPSTECLLPNSTSGKNKYTPSSRSFKSKANRFFPTPPAQKF